MNETLTKTENNNGRSVATPSAPSRPNYLTPLANIVETGDGYLLEAEMPGVSKDGLEISVNNGELVVFGRRAPFVTKGEPIYRESRGWDYRRSFELDPSIDVAKISARLDQGVLRLHLPKAESVKPRRIEVTE
jgi:HSP20 family protein